MDAKYSRKNSNGGQNTKYDTGKKKLLEMEDEYRLEQTNYWTVDRE